MPQDPKVAERIDEFESSVLRHFRFLTTEHQFTQRDPKVRDISSPKDASVSIAFERCDLRVTIQLGLFDVGLGMTIRDNHWLDKPPSSGKRRVKVVSFEYLVEYLTDGASQPIVPAYGDGPNRRYWAVRRQIEQSSDAIVEQLAAKLRKFSAQVLDPHVTTQFCAVDEFYRRKLRG